MGNATIVVPCYNEEKRLHTADVQRLAQTTRVILVNDGSRDGTAELLDNLASTNPQQIQVIHFAANKGKAEAVRQGLLKALSDGAAIVGYLDADLSTPVEEIPSMLDFLRKEEVDVVLGSRVRLLGRNIQRQIHRHYLGRIFSTGASLALQLPVYDTQCGAKLFRDRPALHAALSEPFISRWIFDVELIGRLVLGNKSAPGLPLASIVEIPVHTWVDVRGSKLSFWDMARAAFDLFRIAADLRYRRQVL